MKYLFPILLFLVCCNLSQGQNAASVQKRNLSLYQEALNLSQQGNSTRSKQLLSDILKSDSTFYMAFFALADLSHESGNSAEEASYLGKGLKLAGDSYPAGYKFLAEILFRNGEYGEALSNINHFAKLKKSFYL